MERLSAPGRHGRATLRRATLAPMALLVGLAFAGCYGSTEPATDVTADTARLNARGTANNGPATSSFELWPTNAPSAKLNLLAATWPAGASGPFSLRVGGLETLEGPLYPATSYAFRLCGNDERQPPVCAQTRTFTTKAVARDLVKGNWSDGGFSPHADTGTVEVSVDASGRPFGLVTLSNRHSGLAGYSGRVTCLVVKGRTAVVGSVGEVNTDAFPQNPNLDPPNASSPVTIVDGGPGVVDQVGGTRPTAPFVSRPDCTSPPPAAAMTSRSAIVVDLP